MTVLTPLADIAAAKDIYRVYGDVQLLDKLNGNYRALFAMETVQAAKTRLQKLIAIENVRKKILTQLAYLNCGSPLGLHDNPLYKISKEQAGAMIQSKDSTVYYKIDKGYANIYYSKYMPCAIYFVEFNAPTLGVFFIDGAMIVLMSISVWAFKDGFKKS